VVPSRRWPASPRQPGRRFHPQQPSAQPVGDAPAQSDVVHEDGVRLPLPIDLMKPPRSVAEQLPHVERLLGLRHCAALAASGELETEERNQLLGGCRGSTTVKMVPTCSADVTLMLPPCAFTMAWVI
jgi:hypothetical protein